MLSIHRCLADSLMRVGQLDHVEAYFDAQDESASAPPSVDCARLKSGMWNLEFEAARSGKFGLHVMVRSLRACVRTCVHVHVGAAAVEGEQKNKDR